MAFFVVKSRKSHSFTEHSRPIDSPPIQIDPSELGADIQSVLDWIKSYNKKRIKTMTSVSDF